MRKFRILSTIYLLAALGLFAAVKLMQRQMRDTKPPVVTCESDTLTVSVHASDADLLEGVTAQDERSGDVTDSLVVESISGFIEEGKRIITYAALDDQNNVGRAERTLMYKDYKPPVFHMSSSLCFAVGQKIDLLSGISAESSIDGSLTSKIKYKLDESIDMSQTGIYPIEYQVVDSTGTIQYLSTYVEICQASMLRNKVDLTDYLIYFPLGEAFDPIPYYAGSRTEGFMHVEGNVNTNEAGTYYVDYFVDGITENGKSRLVVVVQ